MSGISIAGVFPQSMVEAMVGWLDADGNWEHPRTSISWPDGSTHQFRVVAVQHLGDGAYSVSLEAVEGAGS